MSDSVGQEIASIETAIRDAPADYWRDEGMQNRYRALIDARDNGGARPAARNAYTRELAQIEKTMRTDMGAYWKSPEMRARYERLLGETHNAPVQEEKEFELAAPVTPDVARRMLPATVVGEWDEDPAGFTSAFHRCTDGIRSVLWGIHDTAKAREFIASFERLPPRVKTAIYLEAGSIGVGYVKSATDDEVGGFRTLYGGNEMIAAWGPRARRNIAVAQARFLRMRGDMSADDRAAFNRWWRGLLPRAHQCVIWVLAGGNT